MATWLTNLNYCAMAVLPSASMLFLCQRSLGSLWKVVTLSLVLQLVLSVVYDALIVSCPFTGTASKNQAKEKNSYSGGIGDAASATTFTVTASATSCHLLVSLAMELVACAVLDPLVTANFFAFALHHPRARRALHLDEKPAPPGAAEKNLSSTTPARNEEAAAEEEEESREGSTSRLFRDHPLVAGLCTRWEGVQHRVQASSAVMAVVAPWCLMRLVLRYWSTWYYLASSPGDVDGVWGGGYELFFYAMGALRMASRLNAPFSSSSSAWSGAVEGGKKEKIIKNDDDEGEGDDDHHHHRDHRRGKGSSQSRSRQNTSLKALCAAARRSVWTRVAFIMMCAAAVVVAVTVLQSSTLIGSNDDRRSAALKPVNIQLVVSMLWSVS